MDQTLASIHVLLKLSPKSQTVSIILIDKHNLMMYIKEGHSVIYPSKTIESTRGCGILPIGMTVKSIYTSGLRWNLGDASSQQGCELDMA